MDPGVTVRRAGRPKLLFTGLRVVLPAPAPVLKNQSSTTALVFFLAAASLALLVRISFVYASELGLTRKSLFDIFAKNETRFWDLNFRALKFSSESRLMIFLCRSCFQDRQTGQNNTGMKGLPERAARTRAAKTAS
jgi:hypothetical protein